MSTPLQPLLDRLGWSRQHAASLIGCSETTVRQWASGRNSRGNPCAPPPEVVAWLHACAEAVEGVGRP